MIIDTYPIIWSTGQKVFQVAIILLGCKYILKLITVFVDALFKGENQYFRVNSAKAKTLGTILKSLFSYVLYFTAGITTLNIFEVPTAPLLASAGIVGLALSFGAQSLVRDVLTGFFILLEDQFSVSDYITVTGVSGYVEELGLRVTKLRNFTGELHIIPNGLISQVTNHSRGNMSAVVDVSIAYEENIDNAINVLEDLCIVFTQKYQEVIEVQVLGVQAFGANEVIIRVFAKTVPMEQWKIERQLRKEIKNTFDEKGIEIPYPRHVLIDFNRQEQKQESPETREPVKKQKEREFELEVG